MIVEGDFMNRNERARLAAETLEIISRGSYESRSGKRVEIAQILADCLLASKLYRPENFNEDFMRLDTDNSSKQTRFEVNNETTLSAAVRVAKEFGGTTTLCLNFASAKNPGGGFLSGSQAQEESLARSSGLYASLTAQNDYYSANRACHSALYTDCMILSPAVPVFRDDNGALLDELYTVGMLTAPAVNGGAVYKNEPSNVSNILPTMRARIEKVLTIAFRHDYQHLVLGAWGCGVFGNDPEVMAALFAEQLLDGRFTNRFESVVFAVLDNTFYGQVIEAFRRHFE